MKECAKLHAGERLGDYTIVKLLGKGGMGAVYLVHDAKGAPFAAKVMILPDDDDRRDWRRRFAKEAGFAMTVHHKNLVAVHDMGEVESAGICYIIMDYMPGGTLSDLLKRRGRLGVREAVDIAIAIASVLEVAHGVGAVHRDIKPDNILFDADGTPKLTDMGIAKFGGANGSTTVTATGVIVGTPAYMSPEQMMDSHSVDARADIYSLGLVLYEMLTGTRPHADSTVVELIAKAIKGEELPDIRTVRPEVSVALSYVLSLMVAVKPEQRIVSAMEAAKMLYDAATDRLVMKRRPSRLFATARCGRVRGARMGVKAVAAWTIGGIMFVSAIAVGGWWMNKPENPGGGSEISVRGTEPSKPMAEKRDWKYTIHGTNVTITGVTPATGAIKIPSEIRDGDKTYVVTGIGKGAFRSCYGLKGVTIPDSVTSIGESAFGYCDGLTSMTIPDSVTDFGAFALDHCENLESVTIGNGVTSIDSFTFQNCERLANVTIGKSVMRICSSAFHNCSGFRAFTVANDNPVYSSVNGLLLTKDGKTLVNGINGDVKIPATVMHVEDDAFSNYSELKSFAVANDNPVYSSVNGLLLTKNGRTLVKGVNGEVMIPDGVTRIGNGAFSGCRELTSVAIPNSVISIGNEAFARCVRFENVAIPESVESIGIETFAGCVGLTHMTIPVGVKSIGGGAFAGCKSLKSFDVVPNNASYSFDKGFLLSKDGKVLVAGIFLNGWITVPDSVTVIGDGAFYGLENLTSVTASDSKTGTTETGYRPTDGSMGMVLPNAITHIGSRAFSQCRNLKVVVMPKSVTSIGSHAFSYCYNLKSVAMSEVLTSIGRDAFYCCNRLSRVVLPDSVTMIEGSAFYGCDGLKSVTFGKSVMSIETFAFSNCDKLKNVTFMGDAPDLGNGVFRSVSTNCTVWVSRNSTGWDVDIPGKWQGMNIRYKDEANEKPVVNTADFDIRDGVLRGTKLRGVDEIVVPSGVKSVCIDGLVHSGVKTIIIPEGVKHIGRVSGGYYPGTKLEEVRLPASVSSLAITAFDGNWRKLKKITVAPGSPYVVRDGCLVDTRNNTLVFALPSNGKIVVPDTVKTIGEYAFNYNSVEEVVVPNSVVKIARKAFDDCRQLERITLPASVAEIGKDAFSNCGKLVSVDIAPGNERYATKDGLLIDMKTTTLLRAFGPLEKVVIPSEVKTIGEGSFSFLKSLTSMTVPDTVNRIEDDAFSYCSNMIELRLPARVGYCGGHFIMGCKSLMSVKIPMGMTELAGNYSIGGCKSLRELVLPRGLQYIGAGGLGAVCECDMLERIYIPASVVRIASGSGFAKNPSLKEFDVDSASKEFCSDSGVLFSKAKTRLIRCPEAKEGVYTIPNTVLQIDACAFNGCRYLTEIRIPDSVREIGYSAFKDCTAITNRYHSTEIKGENGPHRDSQFSGCRGMGLTNEMK